MFVDFASPPKPLLTPNAIREHYAAYRRLISYDGFRRRERTDRDDVTIISPREFAAAVAPKTAERGLNGADSPDVEFAGVTRHSAATPIDLTRRKKKFRYKMAEKSGVAAGKDGFRAEKAKKVSFGKRRRQIVKGLTKGSGGCEQTRVKVPLFDPITLQRIETPARGKDCKHISAFNLETFLSQFDGKETTQKCPVCMKKVPLKKLVIDGYLKEVLEKTTSTTKYFSIDKSGEWMIEAEETKKTKRRKTTLIDLVD